MGLESEGRCQNCGIVALLGECLCDKCWDKKADSFRFNHGRLSSGEKKATFSQEVVYYVMHDGSLVKTSRREFMLVISDVGYHDIKYLGEKASHLYKTGGIIPNL